MSAITIPPSPPLVPAGAGHTTRRKMIELGGVLAGVLAVVLISPLTRPSYLVVTAGAIAGLALYILYGLVRIPGAARRWGFIGHPRRADGVARGAVWAVGLVAAAVAPVVALRVLLPHPVLIYPEGYLLWCLIQDFAFFSLFLRNLLDLVPRHLAVWMTAALFGLSHYPYFGFMAATGVLAVLWGYLFDSSRVIWYVTLPHALLGVLALH